MSPTRALALSLLGLAALAMTLESCLSQGVIEVAARRRSITAEDGYPLVVYDLAGSRSRQPERPRAVLFYVQGSSCDTVLQHAEELAGAVAMDVPVVVVERRGVQSEGEVDEAECRRFSTKERRVKDHALVLAATLKDFPAGTPVILVGGSEGGDVAAAVARRERRVTHLVLLGTGGGWNQEEEIRHFIAARGSYLGLGSGAELDAVLAKIRQAPDSLETWAGHPFRRWSSYLWEPPVRDLAQLAIPILLVHGGRDESVPVESARALRDAFAQAGKTNLTYQEYPAADHGFYDPQRKVSLLPLLEADLLRWFADQGLLSGAEREALERRVRTSHPESFGGRP
ncbi:MAG TPA: prolyl oligopeptidase family serine peptidase [Thermoanaerobaculia bacterium]|nr:prolyl oligopeptidase family serine peptidase [Thermoanaerobaculia bacterium]